MNKDEALKLALEALENSEKLFGDPEDRLMTDFDLLQNAITAIREALADSALDRMAENARELGLDYEPASKPWEGLTDEEVAVIASTPCAVVGSYVHTFARAIEAKLREKNA